MSCRSSGGRAFHILGPAAEFSVEIFKALKSLENDHRYGKVEEKSLKTVILTWKMHMFVTLLITDAFDTDEFVVYIQLYSSITTAEQ